MTSCGGTVPLMAVLVGKAEPKGTDRRRVQDEGKAGGFGLRAASLGLKKLAERALSA